MTRKQILEKIKAKNPNFDDRLFKQVFSDVAFFKKNSKKFMEIESKEKSVEGDLLGFELMGSTRIKSEIISVFPFVCREGDDVLFVNKINRNNYEINTMVEFVKSMADDKIVSSNTTIWRKYRRNRKK